MIIHIVFPQIIRPYHRITNETFNRLVGKHGILLVIVSAFFMLKTSR